MRILTLQDEWALMQGVARADENSVSGLYDQFGSLVFKHCIQTLGSRAEAEDAVQEIFLQLWQTAERFDPQKARLVTWVMLLTRRHLIDRLRRRQSRPKLVSIGDEAIESRAQAPAQQHKASESEQEIAARMAGLPVTQRIILERVYLQGYTLREVAEQLEVPIGTVKSALSRGLTRIRGAASREKIG
ncbi:MAG: sigma-70 family RNA polymerase sigma factor [Planctomycetota bacterium]|nr:sigma-70 family RNA polymerase sigma factor [Planctomycetota bacterium]